MGVETIHLPFATGPESFLRARGTEFDLIYVTRYGVAERVTDAIKQYAPQARLVVNVADLHFLRNIRDALAAGDSAKMAVALAVRDAELRALGRADLILTYSHVEQAVITSHITHGPKTGIVPWVVDTVPLKGSFASRRDVAFMGGYRHYPNVGAVKFFATEVMPLLRERLPASDSSSMAATCPGHRGPRECRCGDQGLCRRHRRNLRFDPAVRGPADHRRRHEGQGAGLHRGRHSFRSLADRRRGVGYAKASTRWSPVRPPNGRMPLRRSMRMKGLVRHVGQRPGAGAAPLFLRAGVKTLADSLSTLDFYTSGQPRSA